MTAAGPRCISSGACLDRQSTRAAPTLQPETPATNIQMLEITNGAVESSRETPANPYTTPVCYLPSLAWCSSCGAAQPSPCPRHETRELTVHPDALQMSHRVTMPVICCDFGLCSAHVSNDAWLCGDSGFVSAGDSKLLGPLHLCPLHAWAAKATRELTASKSGIWCPVWGDGHCAHLDRCVGSVCVAADNNEGPLLNTQTR